MIKKKEVDFTKINEVVKLPYSVGLEKKALCLVLRYEDMFSKMYKYLSPAGMFYDEINCVIWKYIIDISQKGRVISCENVALLFQGLNDRSTEVYVRCLWNEAVLPSEYLNICLKLNEYWMQRTFVRMGHYIHSKALNAETDQLDLLGVISESTSKLFLHIAGMKEKTLSDAGSQLQQELIRISNSPGKVLGVDSSLSGINSRIKGYRKGNLIIIAASTNEGKTTLALQETHYSVRNGIPEGYISLEMQTDELMLMMACGHLKISADPVLEGTAPTEDLHKVLGYIEKIKKMPLYITDKPGMRIGEIRALAKMWKDKFGIKKLTIDHLHISNDDVEHSNAEQKFTSIANKLKEIAKELDIPVVALAQLGRKEINDKRAHLITDIKYASGIEQAADIVLLVFRPEHHGIETDLNGNSTQGFTKIIVGKLRLMKKDDIKCTFDGMSFSDLNPLPMQSFDNPNSGIRRSNIDPPPF